jgi:hypothetical protein
MNKTSKTMFQLTREIDDLERRNRKTGCWDLLEGLPSYSKGKGSKVRDEKIKLETRPSYPPGPASASSTEPSGMQPGWSTMHATWLYLAQ